jgi:hypothetical protein
MNHKANFPSFVFQRFTHQMNLRLRPYFLVSIALQLVLLVAAPAFAQKNKTIRQAPVPTWVQPITARWNSEVPETEVSEGIHSLLYDSQHHRPQAAYFRHRTERVLNEMGLETYSEVRVDHDPAYQTLDWHYLRIYRGGKFIDKLDLNEMTVLQMERRSDRHLYDGELSAIIFIEDLRVGDIIDFAYTLHGENPILEDHSVSTVFLNAGFPMDQRFCREILPAAFDGKFNYKNGAPTPKESSFQGLKAYDWHAYSVPAAQFETNVPSYYHPYQAIEISDFSSWEEVRDHVDAFFTKVDWAGPEVIRLADSISGANADSVQKALAALRFVQDQIRYLGMESGINGYQPHPSRQTLEQRFGDCKDKSILLVGLLRAMGLRAWPVLVNTDEKGHIVERLPNPLSFDHCVVKLQLADKTHWLDPTIRNQGGNLHANSRGNWEKGLVIAEGKEALQTVPESPDGAHIEISEDWEIGMVGEPVTIKVVTVYLGQEADIMRSSLLGSSVQEFEKAYLNYYASLYGKIERIGELEIEDLREDNRLICTENYKLLNPWTMDNGGKGMQYFELVPSVFYDYIKEVQHPDRTQPWALEYPLHVESHITARFPTEVRVNSERADVKSDIFSFSVSSDPTSDMEGLELHFSFENHVPVVEPDDFQEFVEDLQKARKTMVYRVDEDTYGRGKSGRNILCLSATLPVVFDTRCPKANRS